VPNEQKYFAPLVSFFLSGRFSEELGRIDDSLAITAPKTVLSVPFDLKEMTLDFAADYREVLPSSASPTQWLFHGHPANALKGTALQVALARLCGYRWPAETDPDMRLSDEARNWVAKAATLPEGDVDGLLGVPAVAGEKALADRLRDYLSVAFDSAWTDALERRLVTETDEALDKKAARDSSLESWLRDRASRQHCVLFHQRPFLWHIWDGLRDGFSVFVHYHRLDRATMEKLTYSLLGDWIARAKAEGQTARQERAEQLQQRLAAILEGEAPYDIFVRWKPLARQPIGWEPDLDDGVRLNIRPFIKAEVLRETPSGIHWNKDRGSDVASAPWFDLGPRYGGKPGDRINNHHLTLAEKYAARERLRR
jgi:hypothetical protein